MSVGTDRMYRPELETESPQRVRDRQLDRLNGLLDRILPRNRFYARTLGNVRLPLDWEAFRSFPFTTKADLVADQRTSPPLGTITTAPRDAYVAYHQTSGTTGDPLAVVDTAENWTWWEECWQYIYHAAGVTSADRIFFAFSFGPFIGFWSAWAGARRLGALTIPGGGMDSKARLRTLLRTGATVLVSTPTYGLHLAEVARQEGMALANSEVRLTIHAGEPGASIPSVRDRLAVAWGARILDHAGATEVGAFAYACSAPGGFHMNEAEFVAEVLDPVSLTPVAEGEIGELVVTNLGRYDWPVVRYRTGDLVKVGSRSCPCGRTFLTCPGGLIGRADDLIVLRGVNIFPSAVEAIVRTFDVAEFRMTRTRRGALEELELEVEASDGTAADVAEALRGRLSVRIPTRSVPQGTLPRFELKARRLVDRRGV